MRLAAVLKAAAIRHGLLIRRLPGGRQGDPFADQAALLAERPVHVVLDVGAFRGETVARYRRLFPAAVIYCFEPVERSLEALKVIAAIDPHVVPVQAVVGDTVGSTDIYVNRFAFNSSTLLPSPVAASIVQADLFRDTQLARAQSTTVDRFCEERGIGHIDILKLDIQGGELAALRGADRMLSQGAVSLIYTEILVGSLYEGQAGVGELIGQLERHGYGLYGIYNLAFGAGSRLYQMDAILLKPELVERIGKSGH